MNVSGSSEGFFLVRLMAGFETSAAGRGIEEAKERTRDLDELAMDLAAMVSGGFLTAQLRPRFDIYRLSKNGLSQKER